MNAGSLIDIVDTNGQTPIYYAIKQNRFEMVEFLLKKGVNLKHEDKRHMTPITFAKKNNKTQILELFKNHGADLEPKK